MGKIYLISEASGWVELSLGLIISTLVISLILPIAFYLLKSIGIYKLAKNHGIDKAYLAWVPFAWIYPLCMLVKEFLFFGTPYGKIATVICVIFCVYGGLSFIYEVMAYFPLVRYILQGGAVYIPIDDVAITNVMTIGGEIYWTGAGIYAINLQYYGNIRLITNILNKVGQVNAILELVKLVVLINIYIAIFRKVWPQHYIIAAVMSAFGLFPIFIFICRNKISMSFEQYLNTTKNQYNDNDDNVKRISKKDEPFSEFKNKDDDDPFSDF